MKKILYRNINDFEIRSKLCYQDQRNPYNYEYDDNKVESNTLTCHCSNCVNGKSDLANMILRILKVDYEQDDI